MGFLTNKKILILGVASKLSIASEIAAAMRRVGHDEVARDHVGRGRVAGQRGALESAAVEVGGRRRVLAGRARERRREEGRRLERRGAGVQIKGRGVVVLVDDALPIGGGGEHVRNAVAVGVDDLDRRAVDALGQSELVLR